MANKPPDSIALTDKEAHLIQQIADRDGITLEEAVSQLVQSGLARRVRKRTGKNPAKVYGMKGRKK